MNKTGFVLALSALFLACGGDDGDSEPVIEVNTDHCTYEPVPPSANSTGTVAAGQLQAGAAEAYLDIPVSTALGGYTARAGFLGQSGVVDIRDVDIADSFNESIGIESAPAVKVIALTAGGETIVMIRLDTIFPYEGMTFDVTEALGAEYRGKVLMSASHTHSGWGQFTGHDAYKIGAGRMRDIVYNRYMDTIVATAQQALANRRDAKLGTFVDMNFDPENRINRDRRSEDNMLPGGAASDDAFFMFRIDGVDDEPIAMIPIYGIHGTLQGEDNSFASTDATGAMERIVGERFDSEVVVMHLQGAGGSVSPTPHGDFDCEVNLTGDDEDPCFEWLLNEGHGRVAADAVYGAWQSAGATMQSELALEMVTRSIELGPRAEVFDARGGDLVYSGFDYEAEPADGVFFDDGGALISPIDEFNAPVGAALCEEEFPIFPDGLMPGTDGLPPYGSCVRMDTAGDILGQLLRLDIEATRAGPICQSTRTIISALRIGEYVFGTIPGEPGVTLADYMRSVSPAAPEKTVVLGYAQGFTGYTLMPEDWVTGGFESSTNLWGPLEGEYLANQSLALMDLALSPDREDAADLGVDRVATLKVTDDDLAVDSPAPQTGVVPQTLPDRLWLRTGPQTETQPEAIIPRVSGHAIFSWIGDDPKTKTPLVTLEREIAEDTWEPIRRRSGRLVRDSEFIVYYSPLPLKRESGEQTHHWSVEWQAVPWIGADDDEGNPLDGLESVCGVPLGRYRFRAVGETYDITSNAFEVIAGDLNVQAARTGDEFIVAAGMLNERGFRLLDMTATSNGSVPLRSAAVTVELLRDGEAPIVEAKTLGNDGSVTINAAAAADSVIGIRVIDGFGNEGQFDIN